MPLDHAIHKIPKNLRLSLTPLSIPLPHLSLGDVLQGALKCRMNTFQTADVFSTMYSFNANIYASQKCAAVKETCIAGVGQCKWGRQMQSSLSY